MVLELIKMEVAAFMEKYPNEYYKFFEKFNAGEYYECHDLLEEIWMGDKNNKFLQGLLQMAVAIYHFENGNIYGSRALFKSAHKYLTAYLPIYWELNLEWVIKYIEESLAILPMQDKVPLDELQNIPFKKIKLQLN